MNHNLSRQPALPLQVMLKKPMPPPSWPCLPHGLHSPAWRGSSTALVRIFHFHLWTRLGCKCQQILSTICLDGYNLQLFHFSWLLHKSLFLSLSVMEPCAKEKRLIPNSFGQLANSTSQHGQETVCLPHAWSECLHPNQGSLAQCPQQTPRVHLQKVAGVWGMFRVDHDGSESSEFWSLLIHKARVSCIWYVFRIYHIQHEGGIFEVQSSIDWITGSDSLSMSWRTFQGEAKSRGQALGIGHGVIQGSTVIVSNSNYGTTNEDVLKLVRLDS